MNFYLLEQEETQGWDTYDSCIVAARTRDEAREIHPFSKVEGKWWVTLPRLISADEEDYDTWPEYIYEWEGDADSLLSSWASHPNNVKVTKIGMTGVYLLKGVICSSFNKG